MPFFECQLTFPRYTTSFVPFLSFVVNLGSLLPGSEQCGPVESRGTGANLLKSAG